MLHYVAGPGQAGDGGGPLPGQDVPAPLQDQERQHQDRHQGCRGGLQGGHGLHLSRTRGGLPYNDLATSEN